MDTQRLWEYFCLTGEPLVYLLYQAAREDQDSRRAGRRIRRRADALRT